MQLLASAVAARMLRVTDLVSIVGRGQYVYRYLARYSERAVQAVLQFFESTALGKRRGVEEAKILDD